MSIGSFLFEGQPTPPKTAAGSTTTQYPDWYTNYQKGLLAKADVLGSQPAPVYTGQRVAGFTPQQQQAFQMAGANVGKYDPLLSESQQGFESASNPNLNTDVFNTYKSPYISDVVNQIATLGNRNLMENVLPNINDTFVRSGQFGSSPQGEFTARAVRDNDANILNSQTQALQAAEEAAMSNYQTAMGRQMTGATNMADLAATGQGMDLKDIGALEAAGETQQGQTQKNLDTAYNDWVSQTAYPRDTVNWISQVLNAQTPPSNTTQVQSQSAGTFSPSPLQTFLGTTAAYSGLRKGGLARCRGGRTKYAAGGPVLPMRPIQAPPLPSVRPALLRAMQAARATRPIGPPGMVNARRGGMARCMGA